MEYENDFEDLFTQTSLGKIHAKHHAGSGPCIVFLHGLAVSARSYYRLAEFLPNELNVYLVDLLGHGDSDAPTIEYDVEMETDVIKQFIESNQLKDCYIFGHSFGGWIAAVYAQKGYDCRGIVLEDSAGLDENFNDIVSTKGESEYREQMLKQSIELGGRKEVVESIIDSNLRMEKLSEESLAKIVKPTLIIWGSRDDSINVKYAGAFNSYIKGSVLEIIDDTGHTPHYSKPKEICDILLDFISYKKQ